MSAIELVAGIVGFLVGYFIVGPLIIGRNKNR